MKKIILKFLLYLPICIAVPIVRFIRAVVYEGVKYPKLSWTTQFKKISTHGVFFSILLNPKNGFVDNYIYQHGTWDKKILLQMNRYLSKDSVFVDVGANIGFFSLYAAKGATKVIAFEPISFLHKQFSSSIQKNNINNIDLRQIACGSKKGSGVINLMSNNIGSSSLVLENEQTYGNETVSISTLDKELENQRVDFIKIDVEGYEWEVLQGAKNVISINRPVIVLEFSPFLYEKKETGSSIAMLDFLINSGYTVFDIRNGETPKQIRDIKKLVKKLLITESQTDLLCIPQSKDRK